MGPAGIDVPEDTPFRERLIHVQDLTAEDSPKARQIYETIGAWPGYSLAHYAEFYEIKNLMLLGRVMTGRGGEVIVEQALHVLQLEFSHLHERINITTPDEIMKRHGQAIAAASLPALK